jgi:hypothetical protein
LARKSHDRSASQDLKVWPEPQQFWITTNNNFLDIAVLEWCKLFGDRNAKHYWEKLVGESEIFLSDLIERLRITESMFDVFIEEMRAYRDKFVAHLDDENEMKIPNLVPAIRSVQYLYQWLLEQEDDCEAFLNVPRSSVAFYRERLSHGREEYARQTTT